MFGGPCGIGMFEHVATTINTGTLAVPYADEAIFLRPRTDLKLLRSPNRGCGQFFVYARLKLDVMSIEKFGRAYKLLIVSANW